MTIYRSRKVGGRDISEWERAILQVSLTTSGDEESLFFSLGLGGYWSILCQVWTTTGQLKARKRIIITSLLTCTFTRVCLSSLILSLGFDYSAKPATGSQLDDTKLLMNARNTTLNTIEQRARNTSRRYLFIRPLWNREWTGLVYREPVGSTSPCQFSGSLLIFVFRATNIIPASESIL